MEKQLEIIRQTRKFLLDVIKDLTPEQLNEIPAGFNNNIIWNLGHMVAAQQGVCYARGGFKLPLEQEFFNAYKPESKPAGFVTQDQVAEIKELLLSTVDQLEKDYKNKAFEGYKPWVNRYGVEHRSIEDTISFLPFHDGFHIGYIMSLKRVVKK